MKHLVFLSFLALYQGASSQHTVRLIPGGVAEVNPAVTKIPPPGQLFGAFGQLCPAPAPTSPTKCSVATDIATDAGSGLLLCEAPYDCCLCEAIHCGTADIPCQELSVGTSGAFGVKDIAVIGSPSNGGAGIECGGADGCKHAKITGTAVSAVDCGSANSCNEAIITLSEPAPFFSLECSAPGSCEGAFVGLNYPAPAAGTACPSGKKEVIRMGGVQCSTAGSCTDLTFGVANSGCAKVVIEVIECLAPGACTNADFMFVGDVDVRRCELGASGQTGVSGLEKCFTTTTLAPATPSPVATTTAAPQPPASTVPVVPVPPVPATTDGAVSAANANLAALRCQDARSCRDAVATVLNPTNFLVFECGGRSSCSGAHLTFELTPAATSPITNIDGIVLRGESSGEGLTVTISNQQGSDAAGNAVIASLDRILCEGRRSCVGATFVVGYNVAVGRVVCNRGACRGCTIQIDGASQSFPCDPNPQPTTLPPSMATTAPVATPSTTVPAVPATTVPAEPATTVPPVNTVVPGGSGLATTAAPAVPVPATTVPAPATTVPSGIGRRESFTNMPNGWGLECTAARSCAEGRFEIYLDGASTTAISRYDGFLFSGEDAGKGVVVSVHNEQGASSILTIEEIACSGPGSCVDATFVVGYNVAVQSIACAPGACFGCSIRVDASSPPFPCDSSQVTTAQPLTTSAPVAGPSTAAPAPVATPRTETFSNMANGWALHCDHDSACKGALFTVAIDDSAPSAVTEYGGLLFTAPHSGASATVRFRNEQSSSVLTVGEIRCSGRGACDGLTVLIGYNVAIQRIICEPGACDRCAVKVTASSEAFDCDRTANNNPLTTAPPATPISTAAPIATTAAPIASTAAPIVTTAAPIATTAAAPSPLVGVREVSCSGRGQCDSVVQQIVNPENGFYIFCGDAACSDAQFTIDLEPTAPSKITKLDGYLFEGELAAAGATVTVNNRQSGRTVANIAKIQCRGVNSCLGTKFVVGYFVSIGGVECTAGACSGCTIDIAGTVYPCDPSQTATTAPPLTPSTPSVTVPVVTSPAVPVPVVMEGAADLSCGAGSASCEGGLYSLRNPAPGFLLYCGAAGSCHSAQITLDLVDGATNRLSGLMFNEVASGAMATVTIRNHSPFVTAEIERIHCGAADACSGTTFDVGFGVAIQSMDCAPSACLGCTVVVGHTPFPCDPQQV